MNYEEWKMLRLGAKDMFGSHTLPTDIQTYNKELNNALDKRARDLINLAREHGLNLTITGDDVWLNPIK